MNNERRTDHGRQDRIQIENRTLLGRSTERQGLMPTSWVEFMGIGEKPEPATIAVDAGNDDYRIAPDLDAGNCYYQFRNLDEAMGAIWFLNQFIETVNQRKEYRLELVH